MLGAALLVGGLGNAIGQPAGNALVAAQVRPERFGLGFAIKQSGIPLATLLGGLAVPLIALTIGWRFAYVLAAGAAVVADTDGAPGPGGHAPRSEQQVPAELVSGSVAAGSRAWWPRCWQRRPSARSARPVVSRSG